MGKSAYTYSSYDGLTTSQTAWLFTKRWMAAGTAMSIAEICTIPLDTVKVRLQIQSTSVGYVQYTGMMNCMTRMAAEEGPTSLFKGLSPGLLRQLVYGGLRLGMYDPVKKFYIDKSGGRDTFLVKVLTGFTSGSIAMCAGQPADIIKIRFQAGDNRYSSLFDAFRKIIATDGIVGLWKGLGPNIARNCVVNTAELATYDQIKQSIKDKGYMEEGIPLHVTSALGAGFCAVCVGSPFDVVKTRIMNAKPNAEGKVPYKSMLDAFVKIFQQEGPRAFYKGFLPNFVRLGSWVTVMFLSYEQIKANCWNHIG